MPYEISDKKREWYRHVAEKSRMRKVAAINGELACVVRPENKPKLYPEALMPLLPKNGFRALSLFSGGGGLDLGFERAGFEHVASYDVLDVCQRTLQRNRPAWKVFGGVEGDVSRQDWSSYRDSIDVVHGGPPCQPFSVAGKQQGAQDSRDMWPSFTKAVKALLPSVFVAENVPGLGEPKFADYVEKMISEPLSKDYHMTRFLLCASDFGVPQARKRLFFIGCRSEKIFRRFRLPQPTHSFERDLLCFLPRTMGVREALGLEDLGWDALAPTLRSGFTGPRKSTSILNSKASQRVWDRLQIWPNGVQKNRTIAGQFPPENEHFRLSVQDCAILQGFPEDWHFDGAVYQVLGQIGNSVCPPVSYAIAKVVLELLGG